MRRRNSKRQGLRIASMRTRGLGLAGLAFVAGALSVVSAHADEPAGQALRVEHPHTYPTPGVAPSAIAHLTVTNVGAEMDRLLAVEARGFDRASLHRTELVAGVARMRSQSEGVMIPPGETVAFEPGGLHIMLEGLGGDPLELGETIPATLVFEKAGRVEVAIVVEPRGMDGRHAPPSAAAQEMDHEGMTGH